MRRITPATVTLGVLVSFVGLVGAYVVKDAMRPRVVPPDLVNNVMVAIADFPADHVLTNEDIGRINLPRAQVPSGAIMDRQALVGRRLKQEVRSLTPFSGNLFYPVGGGPILSSRLKPGFRAVTIEATPVSAGLGGLVRPGDIVDILLTVNTARTGNQTRGGSTMTLLQGIEVLAIDKNIDRGTAPANQQQSQSLSVTVAVSPDDANALVLAKDNGQLQLALRNPEEAPLNSSPRRWTLDELLGIEKPEEPAQEAAPPQFYAEVYRGTQREEIQFEAEKVQARRIPGASTQGSPPGRVRRNDPSRQTIPPATGFPPPSTSPAGNPTVAPAASGGGRSG